MAWWDTERERVRLVMLLVLFVESSKEITSPEPRWIWLSPTMSEQRYALSEETRLRGGKELAQLGLIKLSKQQPPTQVFEFRRGRNSHQLQTAGLAQPPPRRARLRPRTLAVPGTSQPEFMAMTADSPQETITGAGGRCRGVGPAAA